MSSRRGARNPQSLLHRESPKRLSVYTVNASIVYTAIMFKCMYTCTCMEPTPGCERAGRSSWRHRAFVADHENIPNDLVKTDGTKLAGERGNAEATVRERRRVSHRATVAAVARSSDDFAVHRPKVAAKPSLLPGYHVHDDDLGGDGGIISYWGSLPEQGWPIFRRRGFPEADTGSRPTGELSRTTA